MPQRSRNHRRSQQMLGPFLFRLVQVAGKAYYALRWFSTRGETGPWSKVAAATVAA
ncbi:MAG: hypothetical protein ACKVS9_07730 [Phycisphaerae bacterium]